MTGLSRSPIAGSPRPRRGRPASRSPSRSGARACPPRSRAWPPGARLLSLPGRCDAAPAVETSLRRLVEAGALVPEPIVYEDFLPRSAAGIFQSNLTDEGSRDDEQASTFYDMERLSDVVGLPISDSTLLYDAQRGRIADGRRTGAGHPHHGRGMSDFPSTIDIATDARGALEALGVPTEALSGDVPVRTPITREAIAHTVGQGPADVDRAIAAASEAFLAWREVPAPVRGALVKRWGQLLAEHKEDLATVVTAEVGKIRSEALGEVQEAIDIAAISRSASRASCSVGPSRPNARGTDSPRLGTRWGWWASSRPSTSRSRCTRGTPRSHWWWVTPSSGSPRVPVASARSARARCSSGPHGNRGARGHPPAGAHRPDGWPAPGRGPPRGARVRHRFGAHGPRDRTRHRGPLRAFAAGAGRQQRGHRDAVRRPRPRAAFHRVRGRRDRGSAVHDVATAHRPPLDPGHGRGVCRGCRWRSASGLCPDARGPPSSAAACG